MTRELSALSSCLAAGAGAALVSMLAFLIVHHLWIKPIWMIAPVGAVIAVVGGLAIGWAWASIEPAMPRGALAAPALFALIMAILAPAIALSFTHPPLFDLATATIPKGQGAAVALRFTLELLLTATLAGALAGVWLGRTPRAAIATAAAGFAFALGPGHNVPMFGTAMQQALKGLALLALCAATLAVAFVGLLAALRR